VVGLGTGTGQCLVHVPLRMRQGIASIAAALGGCGMRLLLPRRHRLRVPVLLLPHWKYAESLSAAAWKEEGAEIFILERGGSREERAGLDHSVPALGGCWRGWVSSAVTLKAGHVAFGPSPHLLTRTIGTGRLSWGCCWEAREALALLEMKWGEGGGSRWQRESSPASPLRAGGTKEEPAVTFWALHNFAQLAAGWLSHAVLSTHAFLLPRPQLSSSSLGEQPVLGAAPGGGRAPRACFSLGEQKMCDGNPPTQRLTLSLCLREGPGGAEGWCWAPRVLAPASGWWQGGGHIPGVLLWGSASPVIPFPWGGRWAAPCPPSCCCSPPRGPCSSAGGAPWKQIWGGGGAGSAGLSLCLTSLCLSRIPWAVPPECLPAYEQHSGWVSQGNHLCAGSFWGLGVTGGSGNPEGCPASVSPSVTQELQGKQPSLPDGGKWILGTGRSLACLPPLMTFLLLTQTIFVVCFLKYVYKYCILAAAVPQYLPFPQADGDLVT